jgi:hypothetical protein
MPGELTPTWHPHVAITQWAVAGGAMGHPVHILFRDYPLPVIGELYRRHIAWSEKDDVFRVFGARDFHQLKSKLDAVRLVESKLDPVRLVLVFDDAQLAKTCWLYSGPRKLDHQLS